MNIRPPRKLDEEGMQHYLERTCTKHNNFGYNDLVVDMRAKVSISATARKFGVTHKTMKGWQERVRNEEKLNQEQHALAAKEFDETTQ